jgi:lipoprotein-anchoring transpeptidase ErfK/SrfK
LRRTFAVGSAVFALASLGAAAGADALAPAVRPLAASGSLAAKPQVAESGVERFDRHTAVRVVRRTWLRRAPGGKRVASIGTRNRFKSPAILSAVARRPGWIAVLHPWMPNGRSGWIRARDARFVRISYTIDIDRSRRSAVLRRWGRKLMRFPVTVGRTESSTPLGRFAVTDSLYMAPGSVYGCCALALTARQPNLPAGWTGGDRVALHGTPTDAAAGDAASAGCLRVQERPLRRLMKLVPVGTRVTIRQ